MARQSKVAVLMVAGAAGGMKGMSKIDPLFSGTGLVFKLDYSGLITYEGLLRGPIRE